MADEIRYTLKGTEELSARFREISSQARRQVAVPAAKDAMDIVLQDAKRRADRVDDPRTRNYIPDNLALVERAKEGEILGAAVVSVGVRRRRGGAGGGNTFYWWWVELGTERSRARPFLRPAAMQNRQEVFREFINSAKYNMVKWGLS